MQKIRAVAVAGLILAVACGDDNGSSNGGSESSLELCERICTRASSHHCGDVSEQECEEGCMAQDAETPAQCSGQVSAFFRCAAKADYTCNDDSGNAVAIGCLDELNALQSCVVRYGVDEEPETDASTRPPPSADGGLPTNAGDAGKPSDDSVCAPSAGDDACDLCTASNCCAEISACGADAGCRAISACLEQCGEEDEDCQQSCLISAGPSALALFSSTLSCFGTECGPECGTSTTDPDTSTPDAGEPSDDQSCLPTGVPPGYCTDPKRPVGHECTKKPAGDCVELPNVSDVYCCAS